MSNLEITAKIAQHLDTATNATLVESDTATVLVIADGGTDTEVHMAARDALHKVDSND